MQTENRYLRYHAERQRLRDQQAEAARLERFRRLASRIPQVRTAARMFTEQTAAEASEIAQASAARPPETP